MKPHIKIEKGLWLVFWQRGDWLPFVVADTLAEAWRRYEEDSKGVIQL